MRNLPETAQKVINSKCNKCKTTCDALLGKSDFGGAGFGSPWGGRRPLSETGRPGNHESRTVNSRVNVSLKEQVDAHPVKRLTRELTVFLGEKREERREERGEERG